MMKEIPLDVVLLPGDLKPHQLRGRTVVVFDVLRASTSITAALHAGISEIRIFGDTSSARAAAGKFDGPRLLCGEENCLPPADFDLGNSPRAFERSKCAGRVAFMSTTNGTRAILAAQEASMIYIGALVNASAVARRAAAADAPLTLLCAGTQSRLAMEDVLGAGAVIESLGKVAKLNLESDAAYLALRAFRDARSELAKALRQSQGGRNVIAAGLEADIDFAAQLDRLDKVGMATGHPPVVREASQFAAKPP